jgi:hypothetical protein
VIQILAGEPNITPGSTRILLDPSKTIMQPGWTYEFVWYMPSWVPDFVSDVIAKIITWWKENVDGIDIIGHYREGDNLVFQARAKTGTQIKVAGKIYPLASPILIIIGLAAILIVIGVLFLVFGLRLAGAGIVLLGLALIIFLVTHGYYRLLALIPASAGLYLIAKQAGAV